MSEDGPRSDGADAPPSETGDGPAPDRPGLDGVPDWEDEYLDRVSDRLMHNYDLERDRRVDGRTFDMYGRLEMTSQKHFLHPALSYAHHESHEHLLATRRDGVDVEALTDLVDLGHDLADEWVEADEEHYSTDFTFAVVVPTVPEPVRSFVADFSDRTMLKYGYHGHYEIHLVVVAPGEETAVASRSTDLDRAFALWSSPEEESAGLLSRLLP